MAITIGLVDSVDDNGVYVKMPGSRGLLRGPYQTLQNVTTGDKVLIVTTDDGEDVIVGQAAAIRPRSTPATSTDNAVARFDGTGGALQDSGVTISDTSVVGGLGAPAASTDAATKGYVDDRLPTGALAAFAGSAAPTGWLLCYGQAVSRTTYSGLFTAIGTTYGTGDGSTTFNLPDLRGRTIAGLDNMGGSDAGRLDWANTLGTTGGTQTHTLTAAESGLPAHTHGLTSSNGSGNVLGDGTGSDANLTTGGHSYTAKTFSVDSVAAAAASSAHNNMQPTMLLNWIIRT